MLKTTIRESKIILNFGFGHRYNFKRNRISAVFKAIEMGGDKRKADVSKEKSAAVKKSRSVSTKEDSSKATSKRASTSTAKPKQEKKTYSKQISKIESETQTEDIEFTAKLPTRNKSGQLVFEDWADFRPNLTPAEVMQAGSFGGTYFRPIKSGVTGQSYTGVWKELPNDWLKGLNIGKQVSSATYHNNVNTYGVKCGGSLEMWEESGWMNKQDPYGWFQWYCRFYQGRRTDDDERQVGRWLRCAGLTGRWRNNLISKCAKSGCAYDNKGVSPVVRQTLQHWAYRLTEEHFQLGIKRLKQRGVL